jgi:hypothetical protein
MTCRVKPDDVAPQALVMVFALLCVDHDRSQACDKSGHSLTSTADITTTPCHRTAGIATTPCHRQGQDHHGSSSYETQSSHSVVPSCHQSVAIC